MTPALPKELWALILSFVEYGTLKTLQCVDRFFQSTIAHPSFDAALFRLPRRCRLGSNLEHDHNDIPECPHLLRSRSTDAIAISFSLVPASEDAILRTVHPFLAQWTEIDCASWPKSYYELTVHPLTTSTNNHRPVAWPFLETCIPHESVVWPLIRMLRLSVILVKYYNNDTKRVKNKMHSDRIIAEHPDGITVAELMRSFRTLTMGPRSVHRIFTPNERRRYPVASSCGWQFEWRNGHWPPTLGFKEPWLCLVLHLRAGGGK